MANVKSLGAVGNGVVDDTAAFVAAGADVFVPAGVYKITSGLTIPGSMVGEGNPTLLVSGTDDAVTVPGGAADVTLSGFTIARASTADANGGNGVVIGGATRVTVKGVTTLNCFRGFTSDLDDVSDPSNAVASTQATHLVLERCRYQHDAPSLTNSQYGFFWDNVSGVIQRDCVSVGAHLNGLKLRRLVLGFTDENGDYSGSGESGIDVYAGGDGPVFIRTRAHANTGGFVIKQGPLNTSFGSVRDVELHAVDASDNTNLDAGIGVGISIEQTSQGVSGLVPRVRIFGGRASGNDGAGLYVDGRDVLVEGFAIRDCAKKSSGGGVDMSQYALGVTLRDVISVANGLATSGTSTAVAANSLTNSGAAMTVNAYAGMKLRASNGTAYTITSNTATAFVLVASGATPAAGAYVVFRSGCAGIAVRGTHVAVLAPVVHGSDSYAITSDSDLTALAKVQDYGVLTYSTADDVRIDDPRGKNLGVGLVGTAGSFTTQQVLLRYSGSGAPALPCSVGSTYSRLDGVYTDAVFHIKAQGAANDATGWATAVIAI
jgi:hypothetical protein